MSIDFPRAWQLVENSKPIDHDKKCSFRKSGGCLLCDCFFLSNHHETVSDTFYGKDGVVIRRTPESVTQTVTQDEKKGFRENV